MLKAQLVWCPGWKFSAYIETTVNHLKLFSKESSKLVRIINAMMLITVLTNDSDVREQQLIHLAGLPPIKGALVSENRACSCENQDAKVVNRVFWFYYLSSLFFLTTRHNNV